MLYVWYGVQVQPIRTIPYNYSIPEIPVLYICMYMQEASKLFDLLQERLRGCYVSTCTASTPVRACLLSFLLTFAI